jgi:hypothetical protein
MKQLAWQVRNHCSPKDQEAHLERALVRAFKKIANHQWHQIVRILNTGFE